MSIVRIGLGENKKFAAGYEAIFGKKSPGNDEAGKAKKPSAKKTSAKKKAKKK